MIVGFEPNLESTHQCCRWSTRHASIPSVISGEGTMHGVRGLTR